MASCRRIHLFAIAHRVATQTLAVRFNYSHSDRMAGQQAKTSHPRQRPKSGEILVPVLPLGQYVWHPLVEGAPRLRVAGVPGSALGRVALLGGGLVELRGEI